MAATTEATTAPKKSILRSDATQKLLAFAGLIVIFAVFSVLSPYFLTKDNVLGILLATGVNGVLALGVTFVIITGGIDLSVGTVMTLSAVMTGVAITNAGLPIPVGIVAGLATGMICGLVNGLVIARMRVPPFIATLGMMMIARGLSLVISGVKPIYFNDTPVFRQLTMGSVVGAVIPGLPIPNAVLVLFGAALVAAFILAKTVLGRYAIAIGSNEEATRLSGVNVANWKTAIYASLRFVRRLGRRDDRLTPELSPTRPGRRLRARCDRSRSDRRHLAERRRRHHPRHDHRRLHHQHTDQRPAHPRRAPGVADGGHRRDRHPGRVPGYPAATQ